MSLSTRLGNLWLGFLYGRQTPRRLDDNIHRASIASRRSCGNCHHSGEGALLFRHCQTFRVVVHRGDVCKRFVPRTKT